MVCLKKQRAICALVEALPHAGQDFLSFVFFWRCDMQLAQSPHTSGMKKTLAAQAAALIATDRANHQAAFAKPAATASPQQFTLH